MDLTPRIEGLEAGAYLSGVDDNGRTLVIMGDHPNKWLDLGTTFPVFDCMSINASAEGVLFDYCATLHAADVDNFVDSIHPETTVIGLRCGCESKRVDMTIDAVPVGGTSALFAVIAGLVLGYRDILLCGVRLEPGSVYHDEHVVANWNRWMPFIRGKVRLKCSEKNWLRDLLS